ncbi:MAG: hypothetical protein IJ958_07485 [Agathobacter sp.]|nr:hypothetical protein [Agathobacter sp.]
MKNNIIIRMIAILLLGCGLYFIIDYKMPEDKNLSSGTSVARSYMEKINNFSNVENYNYNTKKVKLKNKRLTDVSYTFFDKIEMPRDMYPQGICFSDSYIFITMYTSDENKMGMIMAFEKETGRHLLSFGMDTKSHLGGIAFDGNNLWICNSSKMSIERISYAFICNAIKHHDAEFIDIRNLIEVYPVNVIPSCITFYDKRLWVAAHTKITNSQMMAYHFLREENRLEFDSIYHIPAKVQGIVFDESGRIALSTSYGRKKSSYLKIYSSAEAMSINVDKYESVIEMPPCSEGIAINNGLYYILFESAGEKYLEGTDGKGKSIAPLDRILIIDPSLT